MNTIISTPSRKPAELNLGGTSTSEKVFQDAAGLAVILPFPSAGQICGATGPALARMGKIHVSAFGRVTGGGTTNYTPQLQWGTSLTPGSNTDIESGGAVAVNSVSGFWAIEAILWVDDASGKISGMSRHGVHGSTTTWTDWAAIDNNISSVDPDGNATLGLVVTGTFSAGFAGNAAYLDHFSMQKVA